MTVMAVREFNLIAYPLVQGRKGIIKGRKGTK